MLYIHNSHEGFNQNLKKKPVKFYQIEDRINDEYIRKKMRIININREETAKISKAKSASCCVCVPFDECDCVCVFVYIWHAKYTENSLI